MRTRAFGVAAGLLLSTSAIAQEATQDQQGGANPQLPDVEVIQQQPPPAPAAAAAKPKPKPAAAQAKPKPAPPQEVFEPVEPVATGPAEILQNSPYGSPAATGAAERARQSAQTPVNPTQLIPDDLNGFSAAATNLTPAVINERKPQNLNDALQQVPGVIIINDDASAHHGGVSVRGSPARRSRKMLVMEDGHPVNLALWLDPSVHYWGPLERFESVEVIRGTIITHGPNNNFGVINARNISPFGPDETVVSASIGFTKSKTGSFQTIEGEDGEPEAEGPATFGGNDTDISAKWHVHTRQSSENVGVVMSYTGSNVQGLWDTERLRDNDFYGAIGWKGSSSDLVVSAMHARQKDNYDEQNFLGNYELFEGTFDSEEEAEELAESIVGNFRGLAEQQFFNLKHCKTCFAPAATLNTYTGEIWRGQIVHNAYLDTDTTVTSRVYAGYHRRDRYQLNTYDASPDGSPLGAGPIFEPEPPTDPNEESEVFFGEDTMFGRLRTFRHVGGEVRAEWANRNILGFNQDLQAGIRYEYQDMTNRNFIGRDNEILKNGDDDGATIFDRSLDANTVSAFLQTNISVAPDFNVLPGIRFEWFKVNRQNSVIAREESEAGGAEGPDCAPFDPPDDPNDPADVADSECLELDGILLNPSPASEGFSSFNALPGVAFAYTGLYRTTVFGGYHRGLTTNVLRNEDFPVADEIGDNFNLGLRSSAIKGLDFEVAGFYQRIQDYQYGASFSNVAGDRSFGKADEVEISGVELFGRLNSQPFTGGSLNFFGEAGYTYSRGIFKNLSITEIDEESGDPETTVFDGNRIPEVPLHVAAFTLGVQQTTGWRWDASVTWTYRGAFFTDEGNTPFGFGGELECEGPEDGGAGEYECELEEAGEDGEVPSVWLLSARFNMDIGNTGASFYVAGENLLDDLYISDREDGMKPGLGRTIWTGFKYKF